MNTEKQGDFAAKIVGAAFIQNRFDENEMEVCINFVDDEEKEGKIYLDFSSKIITVGNFSGKKQVDASLENLLAFGVDLPNQGANALQTLVGKQVSVFGKMNDKNYLHYYLSNRKPETPINDQVANAKLASLFGGGAQPQQAAGGGFSQPQPQQSSFSQPPTNPGFSQPTG